MKALEAGRLWAAVKKVMIVLAAGLLLTAIVWRVSVEVGRARAAAVERLGKARIDG